MANIKDLKSNYILQIVLSCIITLFNFILITKIYWLNKLIYYLYISISIFGIFYFLTSIISFIYILLKKLTQENIKIFKLISLLFCAFSIITGLSFTIILITNTLGSIDFCKECPFNLESSYINKLYNNYINHNFQENELKEQCKNRRCIFNNKILDNEYPYEYICNYEPSEEFDMIKNNIGNNSIINEIMCIKLDKENYNNYYFEKNEIFHFLEMCNSFDEFYICQRIEEPKIYFLEEDLECPKENYITYLLLFSLLSVVLNLITTFILGKIIYSKYVRILSENIYQRKDSNSLNSTQNISNIKNDVKEESFKKEPTQTIIVCTEQNLVTQINKTEELRTSYNDCPKEKENNGIKINKFFKENEKDKTLNLDKIIIFNNTESTDRYITNENERIQE